MYAYARNINLLLPYSEFYENTYTIFSYKTTTISAINYFKGVTWSLKRTVLQSSASPQYWWYKLHYKLHCNNIGHKMNLAN